MSFAQYFKDFFSTGFVTADKARARALPQTASPQSASKELTRTVRSEIVRQARYASRNDPAIREAIRDFSLYSIAGGLKPQPTSENRGWNAMALRHWKRLWRYPEITQRFSGRKVQYLLCEALDHDGEIFIIKTRHADGAPAIQLVESHQVCDPGDGSTEDGISRDADGRPTAYHIKTDDGLSASVPAASVIHLAAFERSSSVRGLPTIQHVLPGTADRARLAALTMEKATQEATTVSWLETDTDDPLSDDEDDYQDEPVSADVLKQEEERKLATEAQRLQETLGGQTLSLPQGQHLKQYQNATPGGQYVPYMQHLLTEHSLGLIPSGFINPSSFTGTAVRQVTAHTGRIIANRQDDLIEALTQIWAYFMACEMADGNLPAVSDGYFPEWLTPKHITMDYGRDENADRENIRGGVYPLRDYWEQRGYDFEQTINAQIADMQMIRDRCTESGIDPALLFSLLFAPAPGAAVPASTTTPTE